MKQPAFTKSRMFAILDLFDNPVGYLTSLGKMLRILLFFSGNCSETEVSKQLYSDASKASPKLQLLGKAQVSENIMPAAYQEILC
jgi:hypothetical protein